MSYFKHWLLDTFCMKSWQHTATWDMLPPTYTAKGFENNVKYGWRMNEVIFTAIAYKADSAASADLVAQQQTADEYMDAPRDHPINALLRNPAPDKTMFDFVSMTIILLDLAGICYWRKVRNRVGEVIALDPLRPDYMKPIHEGQAYVYGIGNDKDQTYKRSDLIIFRVYDPLDMYGGLAPCTVAGRTGDVDNTATDYIKLFFEKGGVPPGIISSKQKLIPSDVSRLRTAWRERYGGYKNWLEPAILDSEATYQRLGFTFDEMGFEGLDSRNESRICQVMRVPPILIHCRFGLEHGTYENYRQARISFWQDTVTPIFKRVKETLLKDLIWPEFGRGYTLRWDLSAVPAINEYLSESRDWALQAFINGAITRDEFYEMCGMESGRENGELYIYELSAGATVAPEDSIPEETRDTPVEEKKLLLDPSESRLAAELEQFFTDQRRELLS